MQSTTSEPGNSDRRAATLARAGARRARALVRRVGRVVELRVLPKGRAKPADKRARVARRRERHARNARIARRVGSAIGGPVERRIERALLTRSWVKHDPSQLRDYLVSNLQNPVINVQSVLARHHFIRELYGDQHDDLMAEELRWAADTNTDVNRRRRALQAETGLTYRQVKRRRLLEGEVAEAIGDPDRFASRWRSALAVPPARRLSVIEAACGSANDYRAFAAYGLGAHLDYTGFDLTEANVANAQEMFPHVDFRRGDVQDIEAADGSYDWAMASDLLEHLSPQAMNRAIDELCRVSRTGVVIIFFLMRDAAEHEVNPHGYYHVNTLSKDRISDRFVEHGLTPEFVHIPSLLDDRFGTSDHYNNNAWSLIARR